MADGDEPPADLAERTFEFALRIVRMCRCLEAAPGACRRLVGQLLDAGTSVGANVEESVAASSRRDFIAKRLISLRECREAIYWRRLIVAAGLMIPERAGDLIEEGRSISRILAKSIITAKRNARRPT